MSKIRVPLHGTIGKFANIEANATEGATVGLDLRWPDGSRVTEDELRKAITAGAVAAATPTPSPANPVGGGTSYTDAMADLRVAAGITAHEAAENPHPEYMLASASLQPVPTTVADGATYTVAADTQALFTLPITLEGTGALDVSGALVEVA